MADLVVVVLRSAPPREIRGGVVAAIAVQVSNLGEIAWVRVESLSDQSMDSASGVLSGITDLDDQVSGRRWNGLQKDSFVSPGVPEGVDDDSVH